MAKVEEFKVMNSQFKINAFTQEGVEQGVEIYKLLSQNGDF
jgi:hypothetical protein